MANVSASTRDNPINPIPVFSCCVKWSRMFPAIRVVHDPSRYFIVFGFLFCFSFLGVCLGRIWIVRCGGFLRILLGLGVG